MEMRLGGAQCVLTEQHACKLKKPVQAFLDLRTPTARRHNCEEEMRVNARFAAGVFETVVPLGVGGDGGYYLGDGERPATGWCACACPRNACSTR